MTIPDRELMGTIRFAMKATREMKNYDSRSKEVAVDRLGEELGHELARSLASSKHSNIFSALASFWNESGLGRMTIVRIDPRIILLNNCYDCSPSRPGEAPSPCTFKTSLLRTTLQDSLGAPVQLDELECCKTGGTGCVFRVKTTPGKTVYYANAVEQGY